MARQRLTGRDLASKVGWSTSTTSRKVSGSQPLTLEDLTAIADALGVTVAALMPVEATA